MAAQKKAAALLVVAEKAADSPVADAKVEKQPLKAAQKREKKMAPLLEMPKAKPDGEKAALSEQKLEKAVAVKERKVALDAATVELPAAPEAEMADAKKREDLKESLQVVEKAFPKTKTKRHAPANAQMQTAAKLSPELASNKELLDDKKPDKDEDEK